MCLFFHKWGYWVTIDNGELIKYENANRLVIGKYIYQQRTCAKCNKQELSVSKVYH